MTVRLLPVVAGPMGRHLTQSDILRHYPWPSSPGRPWVRANMVASVDGAARDEAGSSDRLSSAADRQVMRLLRSGCDALLVGAATARRDPYPPQRPDSSAAARREAAGQRPEIVLVVVTGSGNVPDAVRAAVDAGSAVLASPGPGMSEVDLPVLLEELAAVGLHRILCEGGPRLLSSLLELGLVDELCVTTSPVATGPGLGDQCGRIVAGPPWSRDAERLGLVGLLENEGTLFARWVARP